MMTDSRDRLFAVDRVPVPDLWAEAQRRAAGEALPEADVIPTVGFGWRRAATVAVAAALVAAATVVVWRAFGPTVARRPGDSAPPVQDEPRDPWQDLVPTLHEFPPPPVSRIGPALVWTGSELLMWGGATHDGAFLFNDGYAFDARLRAWEELPAGPLSPRYFPAAVWSGREVLIWGGWNGRNGFFGDGAAYDPATRVWRVLPPAPIEARFPFGAVWTGSEMIVWGSGRPQPGKDVSGAAYDPSTNTWRPIADAPFPLNDGSAVWTGRQMLVLGAWLDDHNRSETETAVAAAYDPAGDSWSILAPSPLSPQGVHAVWTGTELIGIDYLGEVASFDPRHNEWRRLPRFASPGDIPSADYAAGRVLAADYTGSLSVLEVRRRSWSDLMFEADGYPRYVVAAGKAFLLVGRGYRDEPPPPTLLWKPVTDPNWKDEFESRAEGQRCGRPEGGYAPTIMPGSGPAGTSVTIAGPVPTFRQDGSYDPPDEDDGFQVWWDADPSEWESLVPEDPPPVAERGDRPLLVAEALGVEDCTYSLTFEAPDAPPGNYSIVLLGLELRGAGGAREWDSAARYGALRFELTG